MKKLLILIFLFSVCSAELTEVCQADVYKVPNFLGGMNLVFDSTELAPNEAILIKNFTLDQPNCLTSRHGYSAWNSAAIDTANEIDAIFIYEPYPDTFRMVIASGGYIYICPTLADPGAVNWDTLKLGISGDSMCVIHDKDSTYENDDDIHLLINICSGDVLTIEGDTSEGEYDIYLMGIFNDSTLWLTENYKGATDSNATYNIYKKYTGGVNFAQHGSDLYISPLNEPTFVYNEIDNKLQFISLIDTGYADTSYATSESTFIYNSGCVFILSNQNVVTGVNCTWDSTTGVKAGKIITIFCKLSASSPDITPWSSIIMTVGDTGSMFAHITTADAFPYRRNQICADYEIKNPLGVYNPAASYYIVDNNKNWLDSEFADKYLDGLLMVFPEGGHFARIFLYNNSDTMVAASNPLYNRYYYIFTRIPINHPTANNYAQNREFEQLYFKDDYLYAFGKEKWANEVNIYNQAKNRVWYSAHLMPFYMKNEFAFDISFHENITAIFDVKKSSYVATGNTIFQFSGIPGGFDFSFGLIESGIGINNKNHYCKNYFSDLYIAEEKGIFKFNGISFDDISLKIKPLYDNYFYNSDMIIGYFNNKLYISFPDSAVRQTIVYDERWEAFYTFDFSMSCFNNQSAQLDTNIFFFGNPARKGYLYFYPNSVYYDSLVGEIAEEDLPTCEIITGRQSLGGTRQGLSTCKSLDYIMLPIQFYGITTLYTYASGDSMYFTAPIDTFVSTSPGDRIYFHVYDNKAIGEYFQFRLKTSAGQKVILRPYEVEYQWRPPYIKQE